jgi:hypothetical protein
MAHLFDIGNRIAASAEGLATFRKWTNREGTIIGRTSDKDVWRVRWDYPVQIEMIHGDFLALCDRQDSRQLKAAS